MCGICGVVGKHANPVEEHVLRAMTDMMIHRGPDDEGFHVQDHVGFGFRRLSIVDLAHGHQPMCNEDGSVWIVFNGEIYNYDVLYDELVQRGHQFRSHCDTEVIIHLYEELGIECLDRLRGMFAFAIYDARQKLTYLARDYFGIKPLYYTDTPEGLVFASEIKSLLASGYVEPRVDMQAFVDYLSFQYVPDPRTMFAGISKLPPAHYIEIRAGQASLHEYWRAEFEPDDSISLETFTEGIAAHLTASVNRHSRADVPRGAFLSSGVDSTVIASLLNRQERVKTFSIGFDNPEAHHDELPYAAQTADILGTEHYSTKISAEDYRSELERLVYYQEDPVADPSSIALYFVSRLASEQVTVMLSGEGADEIFGGYPIYHEPVSLRGFRSLSGWQKRALRSVAQVLPYGMKGRSFLERGSTDLERRFIGDAKIFSDSVKAELLSQKVPLRALAPCFAVTDFYYARTRHLDDITRMQDIDMHTWLPGDILMKADKMTMANSIELRVPFLDRDVFEFAARIPTRFRIHDETTKYALREAVKKLVPDEVRRRPKLGFPVPLRGWLRNELLEYVQDLFATSSARSYFNMAYVEHLLAQHKAHARDHSRELWVVIIFMLWHDVFVEETLASARGRFFQARDRRTSSTP